MPDPVPIWPEIEFAACAEDYGCLTLDELREFWKWFTDMYEWIDYADQFCR